MTTPATRAELLDLIADAETTSWAGQQAARVILSAIEAAGLRVVPVEATEAMLTWATGVHSTSQVKSTHRALLAAAPFNKEDEG